MNPTETMHAYYSGQRIVALAGALASIAYLLIAWAAFVRATYPARSFAITVFLLAGFFMLPANIAYFFYVGPQSTRIEATLTRNQDEFFLSEQAHLDKMMRGFQHSYRLDGTVALAGALAVVLGILFRNSKCVGIGLAIALCATTLLAGEIWSKHRAVHYRVALFAARNQ